MLTWMFLELPMSATDDMEPEGLYIKGATRTTPIQTGEETFRLSDCYYL